MSRLAGTEPQQRSQHTNKYIREVLHAPEPAPAVPVRFFYTSPLAIDDPLSPLPPPATGASAVSKHPPRPFSVYDNEQLDVAWNDLRRKLLKYNEEAGGEKATRKRGYTLPASREISQKRGQASGTYGSLRERPTRGTGQDDGASSDDGLQIASLKALDNTTELDLSTGTSATTGNPFVRAPSRQNIRPLAHVDSYNWGDDGDPSSPDSKSPKLQAKDNVPEGPSAKVPVGISRLHEVVMPTLQMEPIYWSPVNDVAAVLRGTWFYKDSMLPVEPEIANLLEAGYVELQPWTQTWRDELESAVEVGADGEMKILHRLWPEKPLRRLDSRPGTSRDAEVTGFQSNLENIERSPEKDREDAVEHAADMIDISNGPDGPDNKAAGVATWGRDGRKRQYLTAGVIYADEKEAYILSEKLQPSSYYGRRPLANYIRKNRKIGVHVTRGFDQEIWDTLHPQKKGPKATKARENVSTSQSGAPPNRRQKYDAALAQSERPQVTDLVLVIHGIGQKLSERIESYHFTHAINALRREFNVELGTDSIKTHLRKDLGGIMVLPVNWRLSLSFEEGGYRDGPEDPAMNTYNLKDITPETLPSVRNIISDVMLDVPYYLSAEHHPKMIAACITEANRIYRLWCANNPGFADYGRVHLIAHSLGSVMAVDILSNQPTHVPRELGDPKIPVLQLPTDHFLFDTKSLFVCGSPVGFFLLLKKAALLPRQGRRKPGADPYVSPGVAGEQYTYGCLAVDNIYNIVNPYDPVAYRLNATVDATYASVLKPAVVPSASSSWLSLSNPFKSAGTSNFDPHYQSPTLPRMPSNVELETHNFSREEIAEERAYLLNDNGQIDWFLKYGGGPLEIQYLTMLGAHSSYWISRDFVRMVVVEVGRREGRDGTVAPMRAVKRKGVVG
ncbi:hypothetical protein K490DRAFT_38513 [Saccharata proteae CBS 121410]|uniref:DDHD domain-containing protein n=1 Tax=Saccharata proteae CBS 121410 TaxID=1314787 RepID=A0A6A5YBB1_9PEZI|nr:hypothetical protein K490DRAFT_38513 [Saccharata proteae CBS 121410]